MTRKTSVQPSSPADARYRQPVGDSDARLTAPTFIRNSPPLIAELSRYLLGLKGTALEIGSGTGEHASALALAFRGLSWQASDPDDLHRASIAAWAAFKRAEMPEPLALDAATDWWNMPEVHALGDVQVILSMNVIHISPIAVLEGICGGAGHVLDRDGLMFFYGPFKEDGKHTGEGNAAFDANLRAQNLEWGLRDLSDVDARAAQHGMTRMETISMPANNRLLVYRKGS